MSRFFQLNYRFEYEFLLFSIETPVFAINSNVKAIFCAQLSLN